MTRSDSHGSRVLSCSGQPAQPGSTAHRVIEARKSQGGVTAVADRAGPALRSDEGSRNAVATSRTVGSRGTGGCSRRAATPSTPLRLHRCHRRTQCTAVAGAHRPVRTRRPQPEPRRAPRRPRRSRRQPLKKSHAYPFCHREERSDVAISFPQSRSLPQRDCRASLAMTAPAKLGTRIPEEIAYARQVELSMQASGDNGRPFPICYDVSTKFDADTTNPMQEPPKNDHVARPYRPRRRRRH